MISGPSLTGEPLVPAPGKQGKTARTAPFPRLAPSAREAPADAEPTGVQTRRNSSAPADPSRKRGPLEPDTGFDPVTPLPHPAAPAEPPGAEPPGAGKPLAALPQPILSNLPEAEAAPVAAVPVPAQQTPAPSGPAANNGAADPFVQDPGDPAPASAFATPMADRPTSKPPKPTDAAPAALPSPHGNLAGQAPLQQQSKAVPADQAAPVRHTPAKAGAASSPAAPGPAVVAKGVPERGSNGSESKQGGSGAQDRPGPAAVSVMVTSQQSLPFRLEPATPVPAGPEDQIANASDPGPAAAVAPEAEPAPPQQGADILIGLDSEQRLEVTIATATRQAADRVEAARADLHRDLAAVGAEVEAIRVEVRPERAPDALAQGGSQAAAGSQSERQGQAMRNQKDQQGDQHASQAANAASQAAAHVHRGSVRIGLNTAAGRIDRYA